MSFCLFGRCSRAASLSIPCFWLGLLARYSEVGGPSLHELSMREAGRPAPSSMPNSGKGSSVLNASSNVVKLIDGY